MPTPTKVIKQIMMYSTCALALGTISGAASAHFCMKKPQDKSNMTPIHPHSARGYNGPMAPYPIAPYRHRAAAHPHQEVPADNPGISRRQQDIPTSTNKAQPPPRDPDIVEKATAAGDFNTLIKAIVAADLYDALRGDGPFTVFAPTDKAFAELPEGMLDALWDDKDTLAAILSYHIVPGRLTAADLLQQREFKTLQGQTLSINTLNVVSANIDTANGIVHVIANVVVPRL